MEAGLLFLLMVLLYKLGENAGKVRTLEKIRDYIKQSKDWDEVLSKLTKDWQNYDIEV